MVGHDLMLRMLTSLIENYPARAILFASGQIHEIDLEAELG